MGRAYAWDLLKSCRHGHKFFRDLETGKVAICDASGAFPHRAADGVLWVATEHPVTLENGCWFVPLIRERNNQAYTTIVSFEAVAFLASELGMEVLAKDERGQIWMIKLTPIDQFVGGPTAKKRRNDVSS